jgi:AraC-like DNA-binding protein
MIDENPVHKPSSTDFRYFPVTARDRSWGLSVSTIGTSHIAPFAAYPPVDHPSAYRLNWERGRVLREFQVVYISHGAGLLETRKTQWPLGAGDAIVLHPGTWHRYRPNEESGWQEYWVGFSGAIAQGVMRRGFLPVASPRIRVRDEGALAAAFHSLQEVAHRSLPALQQVLAGHTMTILGLLVSSILPELKGNDEEARIMQAAISALSGPGADTLDLPALAASLNVSYSWFRRKFKERTGLSPHQFRLHLKLTAARDLLRSSSLSVKEVCVRTGFHSEQYFCRLFKQQVGCTPGRFRPARGERRR